MDLTKQDIQNILALIAKAPISGAEAVTVAILQRKLTEMFNDPMSPTAAVTPTSSDHQIA